MQRVIGTALDGSNVSATLGKTIVPLTSATYGDNLDPQALAYMGSQGQDEVSAGGYKTDDVKMKMTSVVFRTVFMPALPTVGAGNVKFPIVVNFTHPDLGDDSDLLVNCSVKALPASADNSGSPLEVEVTLFVQQIQWTDRRVMINRPAGTEQGVATI